MFTGIIEGLGTITGIRPVGSGGRRFTLRADFDLHGSRVGDSICVSGACLTAISIEGRIFVVDVSPETLSRATFHRAAVGDRVNLERALRLADRIDGHLVSGHLDGTGILETRRVEDNAVILGISAPKAILRFLIEKGSVAVDGVSLTINRCDERGFEVSVIPYTSKLTTIALKKMGHAVNLEADMIGKYVERFMRRGLSETIPNTVTGTRNDPLDRDFLAKFGFA